MRFKQYAKWVAKNVPADTEKPEEIVQALACLIVMRFARTDKLPASCGRGEDLDMDIVHAGLLAGLEKIPDFDRTKGTMRQFLYQHIAFAMQNYAWERENPVGPARPSTAWPARIDPFESSTEEHPSSTPDALIDSTTPESTMVDNEAAKTAYDGLQAAIDGMSKDDLAMLLKDAQIGYNALERSNWAYELGVSVGALTTRLSRLRAKAREWALTVQ